MIEESREKLVSTGGACNAQTYNIANLQDGHIAARELHNAGTEDWLKEAQRKLGLECAVVSMNKLLKKNKEHNRRPWQALQPH